MNINFDLNNLRFDYNSKVIITYLLICIAAWLINTITKENIKYDANKEKFLYQEPETTAFVKTYIEDYDSNNPNYKKTTLKCKNGHEFCSCGRPLHENECYHDEKELRIFN